MAWHRAHQESSEIGREGKGERIAERELTHSARSIARKRHRPAQSFG